jgi:hypothetical protein
MNNKELNIIHVIISMLVAGAIGITLFYFLFFEFIKFLLKIKLWEWF